MLTKEDFDDFKSIVTGIDNKVYNVLSRLDSLERNLTQLIIDVKSDAEKVQYDLSITKTDVKQLKQEHNELKSGVGHLESQFNCLETEKWEAPKLGVDKKKYLHSKNVRYYLKNMIRNIILTYGITH